MRALLLLVAAMAMTSAEAAISAGERRPLSDLVPQESCSYQRYNQRLTCKCAKMDSDVRLNLRMKYYVFNQGNEIKSIHLEYCRELHVTLDLTQVDATNFPVHFKAVRKVNIERIVFEPRYSDTQELEIVLENVDVLNVRDIFVEDTLKLRANNVKEMHFVNSTFAHIPRNGVRVSRAKQLNIQQSTFLRLAPQSVVVDKTQKVIVEKNVMPVNAFEAVYAKDGSHLMISCNRLIGRPISPECTWTTPSTTTTTTTTTTLPPYLINQGNLREGEGSGGSGGGGGIEDHLPELIGGIVAGFVVITLLILIFVCALRRKGDKQQQQQAAATVVAVEAEERAVSPKKEQKPPEEEKKESDSLLPAGGEVEEGEDEEDDDRPRFSAPIWLEEIHQNKIFNRQKSLLSHEGLKDLAERGAPMEPPKEELDDDPYEVMPTPPPPPPELLEEEENESHEMSQVVLNGGNGGGEEKESSRTESDEEFHHRHAAPDDVEAAPSPPPPFLREEQKKVPPPTKKKPAAPLPPSPLPRASKMQQGDREEQEMDELLQKVRQQEMALSREMAE